MNTVSISSPAIMKLYSISGNFAMPKTGERLKIEKPIKVLAPNRTKASADASRILHRMFKDELPKDWDFTPGFALGYLQWAECVPLPKEEGKPLELPRELIDEKEAERIAAENACDDAEQNIRREIANTKRLDSVDDDSQKGSIVPIIRRRQRAD